MTAQGQKYAFLVLPNMHKLMNEKALQTKVAVTKIIAEKVAFGVKPQMAVGCHGYAPWLKPPIFAVVNPDAVIIERGPEYRFGKRPFTDG